MQSSRNNEPRIYNSRWDKARLTFLKSNPLCSMCLRQNRAVPATVVDHIRPHKLKEAMSGGNQEEIAKAKKLFWDKTNWQPLCKQHHDSTKQREEKRGHVIGCDENGLPLDPQSHWRR